MYLKYFIREEIKIYIRRLKDLREDNDKKQKDIAQYLKITQQQYSLYEKGIRTIPVEYLIELSKLYKVTTDYILGLSDEVDTNKSIEKQINLENAKIKNSTLNINQ